MIKNLTAAEQEDKDVQDSFFFLERKIKRKTKKENKKVS